MTTTDVEVPEYRVKSTNAFKLKDNPGRQFKVVEFKKVFGFIPEIVIVEKQRSANNWIIIRAVLTPDEIKKEDKRIANIAKDKAESLKVIEKLKENGKSKHPITEPQLQSAGLKA